MLSLFAVTDDFRRTATMLSRFLVMRVGCWFVDDGALLRVDAFLGLARTMLLISRGCGLSG